MNKTFKPSSYDMRPGGCTGNCNQGRACTCRPAWMTSGELKAVQAAEACTDVGEDYSPRPHFLDRITAAGFWAGYAAILTIVLAAVAAGYLWASYGPKS